MPELNMLTTKKFKDTRINLVGLTALAAAWLVLAGTAQAADSGPADGWLSPTALAATSDGKTVFVACGTANQVLRYESGPNKVTGYVTLPSPASGVVLSADDHTLYVTCAAPESQVCIIDSVGLTISGTIPAGHTARSPVLSRDGKTLYVCNQFNNDISVIDLAARRETGRIPVLREPMAADLTLDGKYLLVANHLSIGRSDTEDVDASVSVIDVTAGKVVKELELPDGSTGLQDIRVSPDGKYAVLTHIFSNFDLPPLRVDGGRINANALTIINLAKLEPQFTFLLDPLGRGAGNPWAVAWSADGANLVITHAGTHEVSVIDFPALLTGLPRNAKEKFHTDATTPILKFAPHYEDDQESDGLPFLVGARQFVKLPAGDLGPRAAVITGHTLYTANYFSDTLSAVDLSVLQPQPVSIPLGPAREMTPVRKGEFYFNDADLCRQGWQSCATCHPGDARVDGLDWQLGRNRAKKTKSLLSIHETMPTELMTNGVQGMAATPEAAVQLSLQTLLFATNLPADVAADLDLYLQSLKPVPSPYLVHGQFTEPARRGQALFTQVGCNNCHPAGLFTDRRWHDVGTRVRFDKSAFFLTPPLVEVWRTAPYLHDGSATTIREVLTSFNHNGAHADVSKLSKQQVDDLCAYVLSL
jgi:YVTN family beta-propeller protein